MVAEIPFSFSLGLWEKLLGKGALMAWYMSSGVRTFSGLEQADPG